MKFLWDCCNAEMNHSRGMKSKQEKARCENEDPSAQNMSKNHTGKGFKMFVKNLSVTNNL
jgi:hypothetical protein